VTLVALNPGRCQVLLQFAEPPAAGCLSAAGQVGWTARTTLLYPLYCTTAGLIAGLFGVGGGIVQGPLMLQLGVEPDVSCQL
jgi:hypothetical protein